MRNNYLHSVATFLIALIVSLPIYSSFVFATLYNPSLKGIDGIEGYIRKVDTVTISVNAKIGNTKIEASQLHLTNSGEPPFDTCAEKGDGSFDCSYQIESSSIRSDAVKVVLFDSTNTYLDDSIKIDVAKDIIGPKIISFTANPTLIGKGEITFNYKIEDQIENGKSGKCVGIKNLIVTSGTYPSKVISINSEPGDCIYEGSFTEKVDAITSLNSGSIAVEAKAYDKFGQQSAVAATTFSVDKIAPTIYIGSFRIFDSSNNKIECVSGAITASASVNISDLDIASVDADFSSLKPSNGVMEANCNNGECVWNNIGIDITSSGDKNIIINATDNLGNSKVEPISYHLEFDNQQPIITAFKTNYLDSNGNSYLGRKNNTIILEINEAGIGFNNKNVYLDLRNINNNQNAQADSCSKEDNLWRCYWGNIQAAVSDGSKQISIKPNSADDLGNVITGNLTYNLIVDRTNPVIGEIKYTPQEPVSGNTVVFSFNVGDNSPVIPKVNSSLISTTPIYSGTCDSECNVNVGNLVSSYTKSNAQIIAEDPAGNKAVKEKEVTIYQSNENATPTFFSVKGIEVIPARIDKKVASQIPINVFVHVILQGVGSGRIVSMTPDCAEMANYLAASPYIMNEDSNDPYIAIQTNVGAGYAGDTLPIKCKLRLNVKDTQNIYTKYEEEIISANVELYGNALGDIGENIQKKLEAINNEIQGVENDINSWEKWIQMFGMYCNIAQTIAQLNQAFQALKAVMWPILSAIYSACIGNPFCASLAWAAHATWTGICTSLNTFHFLADSFFWPVGTFARIFSSPWTTTGWILKIACMVFYDCALADWDGILGLVNEGMAVAGVDINGKISDVFGKEPQPANLQGLIDEGVVVQRGDELYIKAEGDWKLVDVIDFETQTAVFIDGARQRELSLSARNPTLGLGEFADTGSSYKDGYFDVQKYNGRLNPNKINSRDYIDGAKDWTLNRPEDTSKLEKTYRPPEDIYLWGQASKKTGLDEVFGANYIFNPYKSIHYAEISMCLPAIVYNMKKDKQIKCMYRNCLINHILSSQSTTVCDFAYKERECLYVESAQFLKHGYLGGLLDNLMMALLKFAGFLLLGWVISEGPCKTQFSPVSKELCTAPPNMPPAAYTVACGLLGAGIAFMEFNTIFNSGFGFNGDKKMELQGKDYCGGTDDGL